MQDEGIAPQEEAPAGDATGLDLHPELIERVRRLLDEGEAASARSLLDELHPADQAALLSELSDEPQQSLLAELSPEDAAKVLEQLEPEEAVEVFGEVETPVLSDILDEVRPEIAADILGDLPEDRSQDTLAGMDEAKDVIPLLAYEDESAGGVMTPEFLSVRADLTAANALDSLRLLGREAEKISTLFIVDGEGRLVGSLGVTRLALSRPGAVVRDIMDSDPISVTSETDQEQCARLMERYGLSYLPVADEDRRLIGVISIEDVLDVLDDEATEDMYKMAGIEGERVFGPLVGSVRRRLPWLYINLATTLIAASVIAVFESTIARLVTLAVFLPVIAGQGGIAGVQTLTLVIRSMALGTLPRRRSLRLVVRELLLGLIHGALVGAAIGLLAMAWKGNATLGAVVFLAMLGNMVVAGLAGAFVPLLLRRLRLDPAVSSAVFVTTVTDVTGFLLFLALAAGLITYLE